MQLIIHEGSGDSVKVGYECPCGCSPSVSYARAAESVHEGCCCGNEFTVGGEDIEPLEQRPGFHSETQSFEAPWGAPLRASWMVGPSVHADRAAGVSHGDAHEHHTEQADGDEAATVMDPVCGMTVEPTAAEGKGLHSAYQGRDHYFCGRGCKLDFDEDPERYLDPSYVPAM